jgi:hypothetical protein
MTISSKDNNVVTLINVFTVELQHQQRLVGLLVEATEKMMKQISGFISANIHQSFIKYKQSWGSGFRSGLLEIPQLPSLGKIWNNVSSG